MKDITLEFVKEQRRIFLNDPNAVAYANGVMKNGALATSIHSEIQKSLPYIFEVDIWDGGVTDQHNTGRCWAFASLNIVRHNMRRNLQIAEKNFELSQNYIFFFDQLEKCSRFLNRMIDLIDVPLEDSKVANALRRPIRDNGMWYTFCDLADKYGVVPKYMMPDTHCSLDSKYLVRILEQKLKLSVKQLRDAYNGQDSIENLYVLKEKQIAGVFSILTRFLGAPPQIVQFEYKKTDGSMIKLPEMSPQEFYCQYGDVKTSDYCFIINYPDPQYPFKKCYSESPEDGRINDKRFNLEMETIKQLVINSLKGGDQVVMGCDVAKQSDKPSGYMHPALLDYENVFGTDLEFPDRASWIAYKGHNGSTSGLHIMTFDGVHFDESGKPMRWKVHNSYGPTMGIQGHYVMDDNWFDRYVSSVVVHRKYLTEDLLEIFDGIPDKMDSNVLF